MRRHDPAAGAPGQGPGHPRSMHQKAWGVCAQRCRHNAVSNRPEGAGWEFDFKTSQHGVVRSRSLFSRNSMEACSSTSRFVHEDHTVRHAVVRNAPRHLRCQLVPDAIHPIGRCLPTIGVHWRSSYAITVEPIGPRAATAQEVRIEGSGPTSLEEAFEVAYERQNRGRGRGTVRSFEPALRHTVDNGAKEENAGATTLFIVCSYEQRRRTYPMQGCDSEGVFVDVEVQRPCPWHLGAEVR